MMRGIALSGVAALLAFPPAPARSEMLLNYHFSDNNSVVDTIAAGTTATDFLSGGGLTNINYTGSANARGWNPSNSAADALSRGDYWMFTVTADPGKTLDLATLTFDQKQGTTGPDNFQLDVDGILIGLIQTATTSYSSRTYDLSAFTGLTTTTFRLLAWNADNNGSQAQWYVDNISLHGAIGEIIEQTSSAAPLPPSLALLGTGALPMLGYLGLLRRRVRQIAA